MALRQVNPMLRHFACSQLPQHFQALSLPIGELAYAADDSLPDCAEKTAGLRKLLEAQDCFVRASLDKVPTA